MIRSDVACGLIGRFWISLRKQAGLRAGSRTWVWVPQRSSQMFAFLGKRHQAGPATRKVLVGSLPPPVILLGVDLFCQSKQNWHARV